MGLNNEDRESYVSIYFCGVLLDINSFVKTSASGIAGSTQSRGRKTIESIAVLCRKKKSVLQILLLHVGNWSLLKQLESG